MSGIFGGSDNGAVELQRKIAKENQNKQIAALAKQSAEIDQGRAKAKGGGRAAKGNRLLTFIGTSGGQETLG